MKLKRADTFAIFGSYGSGSNDLNRLGSRTMATSHIIVFKKKVIGELKQNQTFYYTYKAYQWQSSS